MHDQFTDIALARPRRQERTAHRRTSFLSRSSQITDAAFADLDSTTLRLDEPVPAEARKVEQPCDDLVQQLAGQLIALDQQRERLTRLLSDLQSPHILPPSDG